mmetsp:Transcript_39563/g.47560  ORF Transcript_39563/g.47560 Transcript_39563/m.47560 type:complete len:206 (+) Transcript_39563:29-646(+)
MRAVHPPVLVAVILSITLTVQSFSLLQAGPVAKIKLRAMTQNDESTGEQCTTNAEDQEAVTKLKSRLESNSAGTPTSNPEPSESWRNLPCVSIDEGAHKYVLIEAETPSVTGEAGECRTFVVSKRGASYHRNAAEPMIDILEKHQFRNIQVTGGGRILLEDDEKKISIFGYSYGFGKADHAVSKRVIESDDRYKDFEVTWSDAGY